MPQTETTTHNKENQQAAELDKRINFEQNTFLTAADVALAPQMGVLESRSDAILGGYIYSSPMDTVTGEDMADKMVKHGHFAVVCRFLPEEWFRALVKHHNNENVFFAIGSKKRDVEILTKGISLAVPAEVEPRISINIDIAHGDTERTHRLYQWYSQQDFVHQLMSGSICTPAAAIRCVKNGCTHLRVGIGPGSACTTRLKTGIGVPQLSAISLIHEALLDAELRDQVKIIADGGIRYPGDAIKYMAAGADGVMLGQKLSKCKESCGWTLGKTHWWQRAKLHKRYRGQASKAFQSERLKKTPACPEGTSGPIIYPEESVEAIIKEFEGGARSALSYLGLRSLDELQPENVSFLRITPSAIAEGQPHGE